MMLNALKEAAVFSLLLLWPAVLAFVVCFVRGIKAERSERRERKEANNGYTHI